LLLISGGWSQAITRACFSLSSNIYVAALIYVFIAGAFLELIMFSFTFSSSFLIERRFALLRQGFLSWLKDYAKKVIISSILFLIMFFVFYFLIVNFSSLWWVYGSVFYFFVSIVLAKVFPMLIIPMFYKLTKISDDALREKLKDLANKAGVKIVDIYNIALGAKTVKANAAVCGIGKSKRILLSDTLLEKYSGDEIEATLAHELSHHKHRHFWKLNFLSAVSMVLVLFLIDAALSGLVLVGLISVKHSISALPVSAMIFILYSFAMSPVFNCISRAYETQADKDAISLTGKPQALYSLMQKLCSQNLSDPSPGILAKIFFYDHPPAGERMQLCRRAQEKQEKI
jgi:STE24 endopeptidase